MRLKRFDNLIYILPFAVLASCHSAKKIQTLPKDKQIAIVAPAKTAPVMTREDSLVWGKKLIDSVNLQLPKFNTFSGRMSVSYESTDLSQDVNASIRIQKDTTIWISLTGPFGIEGARVLISPDSVLLMNKLNKSVERHPITFLEKLIHVPLSFNDFQNILIGGPVIYNGTVENFSFDQNGAAIIQLLAGTINNSLTVNKSTTKVISAELVDNSLNGRKCTVNYSDFDNSAANNFPKKRTIKVSGTGNISINLTYKDYEFDKQIDFPFNIPSNYKNR